MNIDMYLQKKDGKVLRLYRDNGCLYTEKDFDFVYSDRINIQDLKTRFQANPDQIAFDEIKIGSKTYYIFIGNFRRLSRSGDYADDDYKTYYGLFDYSSKISNIKDLKLINMRLLFYGDTDEFSNYINEYHADNPYIFKEKKDVINYLSRIEYARNYSFDSKKMKSALKYILGEDCELKPHEDNICSHNNYYRINKVFEKREDGVNIRYFVLDNSLFCSYPGYFMKYQTENDPYYNLIDEDRIMYIKNGAFYFLDMDINKLLNKDSENTMNKVFERIANNIETISYNKVVSKKIYVQYINKIEKDEISSSVSSRIIDIYHDKYNAGKPIIINGMKIYHDDDMNILEIENVLKLKFSDNVLRPENHIKHFQQWANETDIRYNANLFYENFIKLLPIRWGLHVGEEGKYYMKINNIEMVFSRNDARQFINNIYLRQEDLEYVMNKAICYNSTRDFNLYLKEISKIGSEIKKTIANGLVFQISDEFLDKVTNMNNDILLRYQLYMDRTDVFLIFGKKKIRILDKRNFKSRFINRHGRNSFSLMYFKDVFKEIFGNVSDEIFYEIVNDGKTNASVMKQRGEEILSNTIKETKAEKTTINIRDSSLTGFKVVGLRGGIYFIKEDDLNVYKFTNSEWNRRCVVDKVQEFRIHEDRLASRLVNIYNEPDFISTIHN